jgi:hypothetical protein
LVCLVALTASSVGGTGLAAAQPSFTKSQLDDYAVLQGEQIRLRYFYSLSPDCRSRAPPRIVVAQAPAGGRIVIRVERKFPTYPSDNPRSRCNGRRVPAKAVYYRAPPTFSGSESVTYLVYWPNGNIWRQIARIAVQSR